MVEFNTGGFYLLAILSAFVFNLMRGPVQRKAALAVINFTFLVLLFYIRKKHFGALMSLLVIDYIGLLSMLKSERLKKPVGFALISMTVVFLAFFKYELIRAPLLHFAPELQLLIKPLTFIGLSFFAFRLIHIIVDVMTGAIEQIDLLHYFNFMTFFPSFLSGPIDYYPRFVEDCEKGSPIGSEKAYNAVYRIVQGAFKKTVVANVLYGFSLFSINNVDLHSFSRAQVLLALYTYSFVLYFDFSGYTDIAIGLSNLFSIETPENFDQPYRARNVQDFWNRWHMSFMNWIRDYLYFPIGRLLYSLRLSDYPLVISCIASVVTFVVVGVWHGDGRNFAWYGLYHGCGMVLLVLYRAELKKRLSAAQLKWYEQSRFVRLAAGFLTLNFITFSWFFFLDKIDGLKLLLG